MRSSTLPFLALLLAGCGDRAPAAQAGSPSSPGPSGPVPAPDGAPAPVGPHLGPLPAPPLNSGKGWHTDFRRAFTHGLEIARPGEHIEIAVDGLGALVAEAERAVGVGDPDTTSPFDATTVTLPGGSYPVQISRAHVRATDGSGAVVLAAAARVLLGEARAVRWSWIGAVEATAGRIAVALLEPHAPTPEAPLVTAHGDGLHALGSAAAGMAVVEAGLGPGACEVYVGISADGAPVEVVVDFGVLLEPIEEEALLHEPATEPPGILPLEQLEALGVEVRRAQPDEVSPITGRPLWFVLDARRNRRDPRIGFPTVQALDPEGGPLDVRTGNEGFRMWVEEPLEHEPIPATLRIAVRTGFTPL